MGAVKKNPGTAKALELYRQRCDDAMAQLEAQLHAPRHDNEIVGPLTELDRILADFKQQHHTDLGTLGMLSGVSKNTMTRLRKSPGASRVDTLCAVLDAMGMELVVARKPVG